jgi:hypothetical protein
LWKESLDAMNETGAWVSVDADDDD